MFRQIVHYSLLINTLNRTTRPSAALPPRNNRPCKPVICQTSTSTSVQYQGQRTPRVYVCQLTRFYYVKPTTKNLILTVTIWLQHEEQQQYHQFIPYTNSAQPQIHHATSTLLLFLETETKHTHQFLFYLPSSVCFSILPCSAPRQWIIQ